MTHATPETTVRAYRTADGITFDCARCHEPNQVVTNGSPAGCEVVSAACDHCKTVNFAVLRRAVFS